MVLPLAQGTIQLKIGVFMQFTWSDFGALNKCLIESDGYLCIYNSENHIRKMSPKYPFDKII